jgi:hypothetical protein
MDFNAVETGDHVRNECTPDLEKGFIGMRIAAPQAVQLGSDLFAVCGTYRFSAEFTYSYTSITRAVVIVAVDAATGRPYARSLADDTGGDRAPVRRETPHQDPDWMENHRVRRYFNIDLLRYLDLPRVDATYFLYALIEDHVSNVVSVRVKA